MSSSYLVQRATIKTTDREHIAGIDSLLAYMGSAEFEFGSLGASFRRIMASFDDYVIVNTMLSPGERGLAEKRKQARVSP